MSKQTHRKAEREAARRMRALEREHQRTVDDGQPAPPTREDPPNRRDADRANGSRGRLT